MQPYKINALNSVVFIVCGLAGFISHYVSLNEYEPTCLIPFVLGVLLLVMTPGMRSGSVTISRVVTVLTFVFGVIVLLMLFWSMGSDKVTARRMLLLTVIALSSFASFGMYLNDWIESRKQSNGFTNH